MDVLVVALMFIIAVSMTLLGLELLGFADDLRDE